MGLRKRITEASPQLVVMTTALSVLFAILVIVEPSIVAVLLLTGSIVLMVASFNRMKQR